MKRRTWLLGLLTSSASLLAGSESSARPGGGSSFKGSSSRPSSGGGSSYRSSSSSSSSRSSSSNSSSSSRSSSGSSYSSSSSTSSTTYQPVWAIRENSGRPHVNIASSPATSLYPTPGQRPTIPIGPDTESVGSKAFGFVFGAGLFATIAAVLAAPLALVGIGVARARKRNGLDQPWSSSGSDGNAASNTPNPAAVRRQFEKIRGTDADFSVVIFEDFLAALYTEAHIARSSQALERYSPYLRTIPRQTLAAMGRSVVSSVIVGAMRPFHFIRNDDARTHRIVMEIESNYTEINPSGQSQAYYACERWTLQRAIGARSRPPTKSRALVCPNCGAPLDRSVHGRCTYCSQAVDSGQFDWVVERIEVVSRETRGPMLTGTTEEQGTSSPTIFDAKLQKRHEELMRIDPSFTREVVEQRVQWIFSTMQKAWSSLEWTLARPCLTDRLWNAQIYWIEAYRQQNLRNITENARISNIELVRITYDKWYQAITVRIHASGLDYTIQNGGQVVGGSKSKERPYTEYWTLVRSTARKNSADGKPCCPACGAPLPGEMAEKCGHCGALVESSVFNWVLSRIEQDDVYAG